MCSATGICLLALPLVDEWNSPLRYSNMYIYISFSVSITNVIWTSGLETGIEHDRSGSQHQPGPWFSTGSARR